MSRWVALLDANVLYPAPVRDLMPQLAVADLFHAKWSAGRRWRATNSPCDEQAPANEAGVLGFSRRLDDPVFTLSHFRRLSSGDFAIGRRQ